MNTVSKQLPPPSRLPPDQLKDAAEAADKLLQTILDGKSKAPDKLAAIKELVGFQAWQVTALIPSFVKILVTAKAGLNVRKQAGTILEEHGGAILDTCEKELFDCLADQNWQLCHVAYRLLQKLTPSASTHARLVDHINPSRPMHTRIAALELLYERQLRDRNQLMTPHVDALIACSDATEDAKLCEAAMKLLKCVSDCVGNTLEVPRLVTILLTRCLTATSRLADANEPARCRLLQALARCDPAELRKQPAEFVEAVLSCLFDPSIRVKRSALSALARWPEGLAAVGPSFQRLLNDPEEGGIAFDLLDELVQPTVLPATLQQHRGTLQAYLLDSARHAGPGFPVRKQKNSVLWARLAEIPEQLE